MFKKKILEKECIVDALELKDSKVTKRNKFFIGSDIEQLVAKAKTRYLFEQEQGRISKSKTAVFDSEAFFECLRKVLNETRTYGETNLKDIARCFSQLALNNFVKASSKDVMPFKGYNEFALSQEKGKLYELQDEETIVNQLSRYDQQLYIVVRNVINNMGQQLVQ